MADIIGVGLSIDPSGAIEGSNKAIVAMEAANASLDSLKANAGAVGEELSTAFGIAEDALSNFAQAAVAASELSIDPKLNLDEFQRAEAVAADAVNDMRAVLESAGLKLGPVSVEALEDAVASVIAVGDEVLKFEDLVGDAFQTMSAEVRATQSEFTNLEGRILNLAAETRRVMLATGTPFEHFTVAMDDARKAANELELELAGARITQREFGLSIDDVRDQLVQSAVTLKSYGKDFDVVGGQAERFKKIISDLGRPTDSLDLIRDDINQLNADMVVGEIEGTNYSDSMGAIREQLVELHGTLKDGQFAKFSQLMKLTEPAVVKVGVATTNAAKGMNSMSRALLFMASSSIGARTGVGRLATSLLRFGGGNPWLIGILAGVAAIALAWSLLSKKAREAKKETDQLIESLLKAANLRVNPAFDVQGDRNTLLERQAEVLARIDRLQDRLSTRRPGSSGASEDARRRGLAKDLEEAQREARDLGHVLDQVNFNIKELFKKKRDASVIGQFEALTTAAEKAARQMSLTRVERSLDDFRTARRAEDEGDFTGEQRILAGLTRAPTDEEVEASLRAADALLVVAEANEKAKQQTIANAAAVRDLIAAEERRIETLGFTRGELFAYELALVDGDEALQDLWRTTIDANDAKDRLDAFFEADEIGKAAAVWAASGDEIVNALLEEKAALTLTNRELLQRRLVLELVGEGQRANILGIFDEVEALRRLAEQAEEVAAEEAKMAEQADIFAIAFNRAVENAQDAMAQFIVSVIDGANDLNDILVNLLRTIERIAAQAAAAQIFNLIAGAVSSGLQQLPAGGGGGGPGPIGIDIPGSTPNAPGPSLPNPFPPPTGGGTLGGPPPTFPTLRAAPPPPEVSIAAGGDAGVRTVVHQTIQFNVQALDRRGVQQVLEENKGQIVTMVAEQARKSNSFRHALLGA